MKNEVEFLPLLRSSPGKTATRRMLHEYSVTDTMIDAAETHGEVVTTGKGLLASVILTKFGSKLYL